MGTQQRQLAALQPLAQYACENRTVTPEWSSSLRGPVTCPRRIHGGRGGGELSLGGSGYLSKLGTPPPGENCMPNVAGEEGRRGGVLKAKPILLGGALH